MILLLMTLALGLLLLLSMALGSVSIPLDQIVSTLVSGESDSIAWTNIVLKFRLPKTLTAMLAGMALGVSGLLMQTYFRNPLAEPFVLGVSSGASLGVALVVLSTGATGVAMIAGLGFVGDLLLTTAAGLGAGLTMALVLLVATRIRSNLNLLILGLMFGYLVASMVSLLLYFALPERIQAYVNWTFGSFSGVTVDQLPLLAAFVVAGLLIAATSVKPLNALLLGEDCALSMGMNLRRTRLGIVLSTALLVSAVTAFCGPIAFIGIAVPHLCRGVLRTSDHLTPVAGDLPDRRYCGPVRLFDRGNAGQQPGSATQRHHRAAGRARSDVRNLASVQRAKMSVPALQTRDLSIGYPRKRRGDICLARALNLNLDPGSLVGLLGPNGVGKSTLLRTLAAIQPPLSGQVLLEGENACRLRPADLAKRLSLVLTNTPYPGLMTGFELVALGRLPHSDWLGRLTERDHVAVNWALGAVNAEDLASLVVTELSDGQRQKLMIARALAQETAVMLLDEPTAFLDLPRRVEIMRLLKRLAHRTGARDPGLLSRSGSGLTKLRSTLVDARGRHAGWHSGRSRAGRRHYGHFPYRRHQF